MTTKERMLEFLVQRSGAFVSGQEAAEQLGITRAAVWKSIRALQKDGYQIQAITGRGYCLEQSNDRIHAAGIRSFLQTGQHFFQPQVFPVLPSTNDMVKALATEGAPEGVVVLAEAQTAGKGRMRRQFFSPDGTGIYMSILLRPKLAAEGALFITTAAAAAVAEAIEAATGESAGIKWVNDVYLHGKKVCGILTEGALGLEDGSLEYAVLGIGINAIAPQNGFPAELQGIAGAVFPYEVRCDQLRNRLIADVLDRFYAYYTRLPEKTFLEPYRSRSVLRGKAVNVMRGGEIRPAVACEIDEACRLCVEYTDGTADWISSGEVSVRSVEGYQ